MLQVFDPPVIGGSKPYVMRDCVHNERIGLHNRLLKDIGKEPTIDGGLLREIVQELAGLIIKENGGQKIRVPTLQEFYEERSGHAKRRLGTAIEGVLKNGFDPIRDSKIKAFIKNEKYALDESLPEEGQLKDPRMILGRDPKFGLLYGRFTTALEKVVKRVKGIKKGDTFFEMGEFIEEHPEEHWSYVFGDASKYDASQRELILREIELGLAQLVLSPEDFDEFKDLFEIKMVKSGRTRHMISFVAYALRCSGEYDTWLFNTLINWVACRYYERVNKSGDKDFLCTGDDNIMAYLRGHKPSVNTFEAFGFDCKITFVDSPTQLEFCSMKFVEYYPGKWMLMPNIPKLLRNIGYVINREYEQAIGHFYYSQGYMYEVMFGKFPFFAQLAGFLKGITRNDKVRFVNTQHLQHLNPMFVDAFKAGGQGVQFSERLVTIGMYMAYGLKRSELAHIYSYFDTVEVDITGRDNRFGKKGPSAPKFATADFIHVQGLMTSRDRKSVV